MIQVNRIYLIFNRLVTKKFLVDTSEEQCIFGNSFIIVLFRFHKLASNFDVYSKASRHKAIS